MLYHPLLSLKVTENKFSINSHLSQVTAKLPTLVHVRDESGSHWHLLSSSSALYLSQQGEQAQSNRGGKKHHS